MGQWKYEADNARWRADLWINGTRVKLTCRGSKKDAEALEARKRIELGATGIVREKSALAFETFCVDHYKPAKKASLRPSTWNVRRYQLEKLIAFFGTTRLTKIAPAQIEQYKIERSAAVKHDTVNTELTILGNVLKYAREIGLPCATPKITKFSTRRRKAKVRFYTREQIDFILEGARAMGDDFHALVFFLVNTGCRKSEAIHLQWKNVDLAAGMAKIWSADDDDSDTNYKVKSVDREVPVSDELAVILKAQKLRAGSSLFVFPVREAVNDTTGAPHGTQGEGYAEFPMGTWRRALTHANAAMQTANPKAVAIVGGPHRLRHTYASAFLEAVPDLFALGRLLGHSTSRVTELYSHIMPDRMATLRNVVSFTTQRIASPMRKRASSYETTPRPPPRAAKRGGRRPES